MAEAKIIKESIVARSPRGQAVMSFESTIAARKYMDSRPQINMTFYKQVITEEQVTL